ncbi:membrane bound O-acyl transferase family-domain-containing protein [Cyathus striatus]|nr:membrane bound O-acyl transferase family-domain-containing protein [Cyathus striatus]
MASNASTVASLPIDTSGRLPFSPALLGITQLLLFISLLLPPSIPTSTRKWLFLPIFLITVHLIFRTTSGDVLTDVGIGPVLAGQCGQALDYILLCDPRTAFKLKTKGKGKGKGDDGGPGDSFISRLKWSTRLLLSPRGIGWTHEPPANVLPPRLHASRFQFVFSKVYEALTCLLIESVAYIFNATNPALTTTSTSIKDYPVYLQVPAVIGIAAAAYARINIGHALLSAFAVGLGVSQPDEWPSLFGGVKEMWCIGKFWSRTWHHLLRRTITSTSNALFPRTNTKSTPLYTFARLTAAFFTSAIIHISGDYMLMGHLSSGAFVFFMLQPFGIAFERVVMSAFGFDFGKGKGKEVRPGVLGRYLGYVWVLAWFVVTAPIMVDTMVHAGVFVHRSGNANLGAGVVDWLVDSGRVGV